MPEPPLQIVDGAVAVFEIVDGMPVAEGVEGEGRKLDALLFR